MDTLLAQSSSVPEKYETVYAEVTAKDPESVQVVWEEREFGRISKDQFQAHDWNMIDIGHEVLAESPVAFEHGTLRNLKLIQIVSDKHSSKKNDARNISRHISNYRRFVLDGSNICRLESGAGSESSLAPLLTLTTALINADFESRIIKPLRPFLSVYCPK